MKIRLGFVSNSSSASYTLIVNDTTENFFNIIRNEFYYIFDINSQDIFSLRRQSKYDLRSYKNKLKEIKKYPLTKFDESLEEVKDKISYFKNKIKKLNSIEYIKSDEFIEEFLKYNNICIYYESTYIKLLSTTSMHNSYNDMSEILKNISLYYTYECKYKIVETNMVSDG